MKSFVNSGARWRSVIRLFTLLISFQAFAYAQTDNSTPAGTWYMNAQTDRSIFQFERVNGAWRGASLSEAGKTTERLDNITWNQAARTLEFCRIGAGYWQWYRGTLVEGVFVARFTHSGKTADRPTDPLAFKWKMTGWNYEYLTPAQGPLVFDLYVNETKYRARLRLDRATNTTTGATSGVIGRLKFYAFDNTCTDGLENEIVIEQWDGINLRFRAVDVSAIKNLSMVFTATVNGRSLDGSLLQTDPDGKQFTRTFSGTRAEVLTYGFGGKTGAARNTWQTRTRRRLEHLLMAGNPAPLKTEVAILRDNLPPVLGLLHPKRDDDANAFPQNYRLSEFTLKHALANPFGGAPLARESHGFIAKPLSGIRGATRSMGRRPLVIAINGHGGSAFQTFDPSSFYWYGDAFARQGYMVMAIDTSHRPIADLVTSGGSSPATMLGYFNGYYVLGDDVKNGNGPRTSIKPALPAQTANPELYTDWEEDGERLWDLRRALDYALTRPDVDPTRIIVVGLSLGGELASWLGALDPRVSVTIAAGFSPDLSVLKFIGSHGCWNWHYADIREYVDSSELFALTAPRALMIETGKLDSLYHCWRSNFTGDKQIARRVRTAFFDAPNNFVHYLHSDAHLFRAGGSHATMPERHVRVPLTVAPRQPGDQQWQTDGATWSPKAWTVFDYVASWMNYRTLF